MHLPERSHHEIYKRDADWKKTKKKETQAKYHPEKRRKMLFVHAVKTIERKKHRNIIYSVGQTGIIQKKLD